MGLFNRKSNKSEGHAMGFTADGRMVELPEAEARRIMNSLDPMMLEICSLLATEGRITSHDITDEIHSYKFELGPDMTGETFEGIISLMIPNCKNPNCEGHKNGESAHGNDNPGYI
jgi:hypothetical protein